MKKLLVFGLVLLLAGSALFADDASVMPAMVGRFYVAPIYSFAMGEYDTDGKYQSFDDGSIKLFNLGFALEYGIINWITAAVQWVPGWTPWSNIKAATSPVFAPMGMDPSTNTNGVADIFAGAKLLLVGEQAPFKSSMIRFAAAPGVIIPLPGPDFESEVENAMKNEKATFSNMDNHVFAAGGRFYFDYVINKNFFINLYNETIVYPFAKDLDNAGPTFHMVKMMAASDPSLGPGAALVNDITGEVNYKYSLTFELEPVFSMPIADGINFTAGLPVNYNFKPGYSYSFSYPEALAPMASSITPIIEGQLDTDPHHILYLNPNVSIFFMKTPLPLEFKFTYGLPVWGQNAMARHNASLQIRAYFALPGAR